MDNLSNNNPIFKLLQNPKTFGPTNWAIKNKTAVYLLTLIISVWGIGLFLSYPKEQYPDVVIPNIFVQTVYVGNSPKEIESLVTRPIEKQLKGITGVKINSIKSTSLQDFSAIIVEFSTSVKTDVALQKMRDAVDKAKKDLPTDLTQEPVVQELSLSELPIMSVNVSGDYDAVKLGDFAEQLKDKIEELSEISRVDLIGAPEREIQINVDRFKMEAAKIGFSDIEQAIQRENLDISGGLLEVGEQKRALRLSGQFNSALDLNNMVVKNIYGAPFYLKDFANIVDTVKEKESYARLNGKNVVTLSIIKRSGENLINASEKINAMVKEMQKDVFPKDLNVNITGDLSIKAAAAFDELVNSIIIGFILVLIILMFFMGVTNSFFVALSVPLSMFLAFIFLPSADFIVGSNVTLNFIVLFALLFGLGIVVDDAIVVIENTHRIFSQGKGKISAVDAAKYAAGEVFVPVLAGTLTTLAPFVPLLFWPGIIGKFMIYLPTMLIFTLTASLIVAYIMNPVFAVDFMEHEEHEKKLKSTVFRKPLFLLFLIMGLLFDLAGYAGDQSSFRFIGNMLLFFATLMVLNTYLLSDAINFFQNKLLPALMNRYEVLLRWTTQGWRPVKMLIGTFALLIFSFFFFGARNVPIVLFPQGDPNTIYVYMKLPSGTDVKYTDSVTQSLEKKINQVLGIDNGKKNPLVESVIANVAVGASDPNSGDRSTRPELGRIQVNFVPFEKRDGKSTTPYLDAVRETIKGIPSAEISVAQESNGPPTKSPVNIEVIRTALFGKEISKLKIGEEEYKITVRNDATQRKTLSELLNMRITYRDFTTGMIKQVPISSVVKSDISNTYGSIKRSNQKRVITIYSNVLTSQGYTPQSVNAEIKKYIDVFNERAEGITVAQTGEEEQLRETAGFLSNALFIAVGFILLILILQFGSYSRTMIVLSEIMFSLIGVLLGYGIFRSTFAAVTSGIGIVGLSGIVVKNGILVIEFADELRARGMKTRDAVIEAGKTRIVPVLLTALAAILALIPLAVGFNINFVTLFTDLNPHIFFGGDNVAFWKPLSLTIIWGLMFAFFMTLLIVPAMYLIAERLKRPMQQFYKGRWISILGLLGPLFFVFTGIMYLVRKIQGKRIWNGK